SPALVTDGSRRHLCAVVTSLPFIKVIVGSTNGLLNAPAEPGSADGPLAAAVTGTTIANPRPASPATNRVVVRMSPASRVQRPGLDGPGAIRLPAGIICD